FVKCPSSQEEIEDIGMAPITNIEGEPGTHDENNQQVHIGASNSSKTNEQVTILDMFHVRLENDQDPTSIQAQNIEGPGSSY
ncbi:hypothetical protein HAX54_007283, partial [Datura stramonium]|nr:hypothetical protein [Datura stramonium]